MKKIFILILTILLSVSAGACSDNLINDADTGEIILSPKKYNYTDGTYYAGYDYYDSHGYSPAVRMTIKGGIINSIRFDYFNTKQKPFTSLKDESYQGEISEMRQTRKNLYNHTLADQSVSGMTYSSSDTVSTDYLRLVSAILTEASSGGDEKNIILEGIRTYKESIPLTEEISAVLEVTFISEDISDIKFEIIDPSGNSLSGNDMICSEVFGITAEEFSVVKVSLTSIPEENILKKENTGEKNGEIFEIYNTLASRISRKRIPTELNYKKLF